MVCVWLERIVEAGRRMSRKIIDNEITDLTFEAPTITNITKCTNLFRGCLILWEYWFYGYRYGRVFGVDKQEKEFCLVKVNKIAQGHSMAITDGQIMYKLEIEEGLFLKTNYPEIPKEE